MQKMTSKLNEGDNFPQNVDTALENSNGNRYSRSYKSKAMDRNVMEKKQRAKGRILRPDDVPMSSISGPIKIREKVRFMSDTLAAEEPTKTTLKVKDKLKICDVPKDDAVVLTASPKGREKVKPTGESLKDETIIATPFKQREKVKASDNVKEDLSLSGNSRGRDKSKQGNEGFKGDQSSFVGVSPIKLREKLKQADILKEEVLSLTSTVSKGQEKSKTNFDDVSGMSINSSSKVREKIKIIEIKEDEAASMGSLSNKEPEKMKASSLLYKEESGNRISPIKLREKVKMSEMSKDDPMTGSTNNPKVKEKVKTNKDSPKDIQSYSSHAALLKFKEKERGRGTEKFDDSNSLPILPAIKIRDKNKMIDTDDTVRGGGMSVKKDKVKSVDEVKNIDDLTDAKKDLNVSFFDTRESMENENNGSSLMTRREGKASASGKSRKMRSMISSANSSKKPVSDLKITFSRNENKDEFASRKEDCNTNLKYRDLGSSSRTDREEIMNSDVSSSQDQRGHNKFSASLKGQNRSVFRVNEEREWHPGDLAWGRIGQHPFWPCMVCSDEDSGQFKKTIKVGRVSSQILHVQFFGDKGRHSWLPVKNILQYEGREKLRVLSEGILSKTKRKDRKFISSFRVKPSSKARWEIAVKEADNAISLSREQRKTYFEDLLLNSTNLKKSDDLTQNNEAHQTSKKKRLPSISYEKESKKLKANHTDSENNLSKPATRKKQSRNKK